MPVVEIGNQRNSGWSRLLRNAGSNVVGFLVHVLVGFILLPFVVGYIGAAEYGLLVLASSVVGYSGLLSFGLRPTLIKMTAEHLARGDRLALRVISGQVMSLYLIVAAMVLILGAVGALLLPSILSIAPERVRLFQVVLLLLSVQAAITLPGSVWTGLVEGIEDYHFVGGVQVGGDLVRMAATVVLLSIGYGLVALVLSYVGIAALQFGAGWAWIRSRLPWLHIRPTFGSWSDLGRLLRFSGSMFVLSFAGSSVGLADKMMLGVIIGPVSVTVYEVGTRLTQHTGQIIQRLVGVLMPAASALAANQNAKRLQVILVTTSRMVVFFHGLFVAGMIAFGGVFIALWMGPAFEEAYKVLLILATGSFIGIHQRVPTTLCRGTGELDVMTRMALAAMVINIGLSIPLGIRWGVVGVALGSLTTAAVEIVVMTPYFARIFGMPLGSYIRECFGRSWIAVAITAAAAFVLRQTVLAPSWFVLVLVSLATAGVGALAFWMVSLTPEERIRLRNVVENRIRSLRYASPTSSGRP